VQARDEAQAVVRLITGEPARLAERAAAEAEKLLAGARRSVRQDPGQGRRTRRGRRSRPGCGRLRRAVNDLTGLLAAIRRIAASRSVS
jgi:IS5 family transposase